MNAITELHGSGVRESEPLTRSGPGGPEPWRLKMDTCSTCIFSAEDYNPNGVLSLTCRRYAPRAGVKSWRAEWPYILEDEWCGEHQSAQVPLTGDAGLSIKSDRIRKTLRRAAVLEATGWSVPTLYRKINEGKFPAGARIDPTGQTVIWFEDEIVKFQEDAVAAARLREKS